MCAAQQRDARKWAYTTSNTFAEDGDGMNAKNLDFTNHFSPGYSVPEPRHSVEDLRRIDELGVIGESTLKASGFYARIVSAAPPGPVRKPSETHVLVVEVKGSVPTALVHI